MLSYGFCKQCAVINLKLELSEKVQLFSKPNLRHTDMREEPKNYHALKGDKALSLSHTSKETYRQTETNKQSNNGQFSL